jgi:Ca2+-binding RTX toxin-like protein
MRINSIRAALAAVLLAGTGLALGASAQATDHTAANDCDQQGQVINSNAAVVTGTPGADVIVGGPADQTIFGGGGHDRIYGRGGDDRIIGGACNDRLFGNRGKDRLNGGAGNDGGNGGPGADLCTVSTETQVSC